MEDIIYALIPIIFILSVAGVLIFRPIAKRLAAYLEQQQQLKADERLEGAQLDRIHQLLASLGSRLDLMEQRLDFTESLMEARPRRGLAPPPAGGGPDSAPPGVRDPATAATAEAVPPTERPEVAP